MGTTTSSFRVTEELKLRLEATSQRLRRPKNWVVRQALEEFCAKHSREAYLKEARWQSRRAAETDRPDDFWERATDTAGWK